MDQNPYRPPQADASKSPQAIHKRIWRWLVRNDMLRAHITLVCGCLGMAGAAAINILTDWPATVPIAIGAVALLAIGEGVWRIDC